MALFDRDYDRDFGYRGRGFGGGWNQGREQSWGDRMRAGWNRMRDNFGGNEYDRDFGRGGMNEGWRGGPQQGRWSGWEGNEGGMWGGHDRGEWRGPRGDWNTSGAWGGDDRNWGFSGGGYDRGYKTRWETDYGDPFNDRANRTPIRMIRGGFEGGYDRDFSSRDMDRESHWGREGTWNRGFGRNYGGFDRGYDSGWF